jgi:hypothetical protein
MSDREKKMAAAMAAVSAYLQQEEEACHQQLTAAAAPPKRQAPQMTINLWGQSGRQSMMQMRNLMQVKAFQR